MHDNKVTRNYGVNQFQSKRWGNTTSWIWRLTKKRKDETKGEDVTERMLMTTLFTKYKRRE